MSSNPIVIIGGEPNSVFLEILLKSIKKIKKRSKPIILITSKDLLHKNMKKFHIGYLDIVIIIMIYMILKD